jgi:lipoprotein-releasing system ATP-binding protein
MNNVTFLKRSSEECVENFNVIILKAIDIYKSYPSGKIKIDVLKGLNLEVKKGQILTILGASGVGKTTLLNLLGTLDRPDRGDIQFDGKSTLQLNGRKLAKFRNEMIGFIFQFHHLLPEFSALENVMLPGLIARKKKSKIKKEAELLLEEVGLYERKTHKPNQLSCGEAQRVAIVRALINNPKLILADEPTGNLDSNTAKEVYNLLQKLTKQRNHTLVMVTHNEELAKKADRILRLIDGKLTVISH